MESDKLHAPKKSGFSNLRDWEGTLIRFEIEHVSENESVLHFTHWDLRKNLNVIKFVRMDGSPIFQI